MSANELCIPPIGDTDEDLLAKETGANHKTKWLSANADRWLRVAVYGLAVALTSCLFAGWQQYSLILLRGGVYAWKCDSSTLQENADVPNLLTCPEQERQVNSLLPLASGLELAGAIVAGVLLDFTGPRVCALGGSLLGFLSYVMLVYSSEKANLYGLSMALTGIAINLIGFPALTLEDYFPTAAATTAAFVIACQCLSSIISVILWTLWKHHPQWTFKQLWWGYLLGVWIPISVPYILLLPFRRVRNKEIAEDASQQGFNFKTLLKFLTSVPYLVMNLLSVILMLQTSYWQLIVRSQLGIRISEVLGWTMPSQAIWALAIGRIADRTKTPIIIAFLLILYLAVMLFNLAMSYAYTIKYSFVQERYPQRYYGTLVGVSGAISGAGVLATNILNYIDHPRGSSLFLALVTLGAIPFCGYLHWELAKFQKSMPDTQLVSLQATKEELSVRSQHDNGLLNDEAALSSPQAVQELSPPPPQKGHSTSGLSELLGPVQHHHVNPLEPLCTSTSHLEHEFVTAHSSAKSAGSHELEEITP